MAKMTKTISVRLDEQAIHALGALEASGVSRSEVIRAALVEAAARGEARRAEAEALAADRGDREEIARVQALLDELSEPW